MEIFNFPYFWHLLASKEFVKPALLAVAAALIAMVLGLVLGLFGALASNSRHRWLRPIVHVYVWIFRGTPALVQIVFWYDGLSQLTNHTINLTPFTAGVLALGVNEGAYMTEIIRSGILAVDPGQREAAAALGLPPTRSMRHVIAPQALRILVPPLSNQFIVLLKNTSLLFVISVAEIFATGQIEFTQSYRYMEVLAVVSIWYIALTAIATALQRLLEHRLNAQDRQPPASSSGPGAPDTPPGTPVLKQTLAQVEGGR